MMLFVEEFIRCIAELIDDTVHILERKKEQVERYHQQIEEMDLEDVLKRSRATIQKRLDKIPEKDFVKTGKWAICYKINRLLFKKEKAEGGKANRA